ncbi:MAG: hypothetical protein AAF957_14230 [Planctomycetota bacterium]
MKLLSISTALAVVGSAQAQTTTQIQLDYNFNGIVHVGEAANPDDPMGYRSISDRGLDFSAGVPADPLLAAYSIVSAAGELDIVHVGNRNTVDGGGRAFDAVANGDAIGTQPAWLTNVDQTTPQTTVLASPIPLEATSSASFLLQVSNGGGSLDVNFGFQNGSSTTRTIAAGDWFGGVFAGTGNTDEASPDNNLSVTEQVVDLSDSAGRTLVTISFRNASNVNGGYAVLAANVTTDPRTEVIQPIPLEYNFNGILHAGEAGLPDDPNGFRSISDRALDFESGAPNDPVAAEYDLVDQAGVLDLVHIGDRNTVGGGFFSWDAVANGDRIGTQPTWLPNSDQTGPQTTTLAGPIEITDTSSLTFLYQISNGGGSFDVTVGLQSGGTVVESLAAGDWFGGLYLGRENVDEALPGANLSLTEGTIDLSGLAGDAIVSITFSNRSNGDAGYAIVGCNLRSFELGAPYCGPAVPNSTGNPGVITASGSPVASANNLTLTASSLPNQSFGFFLTSQVQGMTVNPGGSQGVLCLGGAIGRYVGAGQIQNTGVTGQFSLVLDLTQTPTPTGFVTIQPGETWNFQGWHRDSVGGMATSNFTNGRSITFL